MRPEIIEGDVREVLKSLDDESVQCVVTSPPYWGLRDYGIPLSLWGGDSDCDHSFGEENKADTREHSKGRWNHTYGERISRGQKQGRKQVEWQVTQDSENMPSTVEVSQGRYCIKCGGWEGNLGLEPTPEQFVENMVNVFKEVKRVLRKDGTVWLNLGDSYSSGSGGYDDKYRHNSTSGTPSEGVRQSVAPRLGLPSKNLVGIPWRVALALQADGWYLRSDIIWQKPNPMPESCKDRPTKSHEHIFLLTKSSKYYYDVDAIREPVSEISLKRAEHSWDCDRPSTKNASMGGKGIHTEKMGSRFVDPKGRNKRDVWTITTKPYKEAHFATFPEEIPETCIKAGTSKAGCCADCGSPYEHIMEKVGENPLTTDKREADQINLTDKKRRMGDFLELRKEIGTGGQGDIYPQGSVYPMIKKSMGWEPSCDCKADTVPCVVLDIFAGSGTTLRVASKLGRKGIGIELNPEYIKILKKRCKIESESLTSYL